MIDRLRTKWHDRKFPRELMDWYVLFATGLGLVPLLGALGFIVTIGALALLFMFGGFALGILLIVRDGNWIVGSSIIAGQIAFDVALLRGRHVRTLI